MLLRLCLALPLALALLAPVTAPVEAEDVTARQAHRYFDGTGHNVGEPFLSFWDRYGTYSSFGEPMTEAFEEDGRLVQYFQRARLEYWPEYPERQRVQLTNLGDLLGGPAEPPISPDDIALSAAYFPETGHSVSGDFLDFLGIRGGTRVFGFPTTEPYYEDGRLVQRFQRAILELRPENPPEQRVQPLLLGERFLDEMHPIADALLDRVAAKGTAGSWALWGAAEENATGYLPEKMRNVARSFEYIDGMILEPGQSFAFSRVLLRGGYELGLCYGAGGQYEWCPAGGACSGASTLYRAWTNAGLQVVGRQSHTVLPSNPQLYGRDSTVYEGLVDLVVRNNSGTRLKINARVIWENPSFYVSVEGERGPDYEVTVQGPYRDGPLAFRVNYRKTFDDGRIQDNWVSTYYYSFPPTYVPPKPR